MKIIEKTCFIMGIDQRSGTNFLYRLLQCHPQCIGPGPIWEDNLLHHSHHLRKYVNSCFHSWRSWGVEDSIGGEELLLRHLGRGLESFLYLQLAEQDSHKESHHKPSSQSSQRTLLLTKTPSTQGLAHFFELFPDSYLIIIVRDGRSLVESGVRSFSWDYEKAAQRWARRADEILDFLKLANARRETHLLVRYEDIVADQYGAISRILSYLELDVAAFDFERAYSLGVVGSSDLRREQGHVDWEERSKSADFDPLSRFAQWSSYRHRQFNAIAGKQMEALGYSLNEDNGPSPIADRVYNLLELRGIPILSGSTFARRFRNLVRRIRNS